MAKRLWEKGEELDSAVHEFTVGNDPELDGELVRFDVLGSAAHARMLSAIGVLSDGELKALLAALQEVLDKSDDGSFEIPFELEDCHTAIESYLTERCGEAGKKIHTGRSRNDQVITAMRLYLRDQTLAVLEELCKTVHLFAGRYRELKDIPLPGYTHFQLAMPSSLGMWLAAFAESFLECIRNGFQVLEALDCNPLGTASGFYGTLPVDRGMTARLMGFSRVQRNPIATQNSRGQYELKVLRWAVDIGSIIEKFACDLMLFTTKEFGFFSLPERLTTGSSIMPQKHNPDVVELLRGRSAKIRAANSELEWVLAKLPSNYHRDFQYSKEPVMRALAHLFEMLPVLREVVIGISPNIERLSEAMVPELYATYDAERQVKEGVSFRDAYKHTAEKVKRAQLDVGALKKDFAVVQKRIESENEDAWNELSAFENQLERELARLAEIERKLLEVN